MRPFMSKNKGARQLTGSIRARHNRATMDLFLSIEAFVKAAEAESFANAARQLGIGKSLVTARVKQLEEHYVVALFHRSTRAVRLSEIGERYYKDCAELLQKVYDLSARS